MRILIIEDDDVLRDGLVVGLSFAGFTSEAVATRVEGEAALEAGGFSGMVLDLMLPDGSGLDLLARLRSRGSTLPVLMLTARDRPHERVAGLDGGADDYLGKPFDLEELAARLRAILRRAEGRADGRIAWNGLVLDPAKMKGEIAGEVQTFSPKEFAILRALIERPGAVLGKSALEERLYGWEDGVESNTVEVHVHRLRSKLGASFIETVRGAGYRLAPPTAKETA
ncbi:winged helix-turn-helix domain-containing protein [Rubellimicrobium roseum]|uniref:Response regulator n=1 Tax=Rubellimicrobium roseum TaxID=687525 RepID=A0A5C4NBA7_9RHOB|nr:winged helix-turn-helix domain-containing protein [Rubellimicrobium roseum]TNC67220.1 response regulator [Rubellimicrobium roseum]